MRIHVESDAEHQRLWERLASLRQALGDDITLIVERYGAHPVKIGVAERDGTTDRTPAR